MVLLLAALLQAAGPASASPPSVRAQATAERISVDGALDEPAWREAQPVGGFRQRDPDEGAPATDDTIVRVVYDRDTLYVGVHALDREPSRVVARILERDALLRQGGDKGFQFAGDDAVALVFDPFRDNRNAFLFATNANGAEFDALVTDESPVLNVDWRALWRVAARRTDDGWAAEFAIPFRTLRYPDADGAGSLGVQRRAHRAAQERGHAAGRLVAGRRRPAPRQPGRPARGARRAAACAVQRRGEAVRARRRDPGARASRRAATGRGRMAVRRRRQVGGEAGPGARRDGQARLHSGGGRRPAGEPHPLRAVPPGEARVLPRERRPLRLRQPRRVRDAALPDVLLATHRHRGRRRGAPARRPAPLGQGGQADGRAPRRGDGRGIRSAAHELRRAEAEARPRGPQLRRGDAGRSSRQRPLADRPRRGRVGLGHAGTAAGGLRRSHLEVRRHAGRRLPSLRAVPRVSRVRQPRAAAGRPRSDHRHGLRHADRHPSQQRQAPVHLPPEPAGPARPSPSTRAAST